MESFMKKAPPKHSVKIADQKGQTVSWTFSESITSRRYKEARVTDKIDD